MRKERHRIATAVAMLAFAIYASCIATTVTYGGDCGELITASYRLGIPHPTGYPLYALLGRTFASLVPFGEVAWRYNLLSALFGSSAIGLIVALVHRLVSSGENGKAFSVAAEKPFRLLASGGAGALLAGFLYFSSQSVIAEVYSLNALMLAALLYCAVAWHQSGYSESGYTESGEAASGDLRWAYTTAALAGLALNAHLSCIFYAPGILLYVLVQHRKRFARQGGLGRHLLRMGALFCAAYALTLYLPIRSSGFPELSPQSIAQAQWTPLDWTHPTDKTRWLAHISAKQYKHLLWRVYEIPLAGHSFRVTWFVQPLQQSLQKLITFSGFFALQLFWAIPLLGVGAWTCWNDGPGARHAGGGRWLGLLLALGAGLNIGLEINYAVGDLSNFFFPAYMVIAVCLGLGIARTLNLLLQLTTRRGGPTETPPSSRQLKPVHRMTAIVGLWVASTCFLQWAATGSLIKYRGDTSARDIALERAATIEKLAASSGKPPVVLLMDDDALWTFWYARYVLGRAPVCTTPWGRYRNDAFDGGTTTDLVGEWRKQGPVVISRWEEKVDRKYPFVMLTESGDICLASDRTLPPAAKLLGEAALGANAWTVQRAAFRSNPLAPAGSPGDKASAARVQRCVMAALDFDFSLRDAQPLSPAAAGGPVIDARSSAQAMQIGYVEVFMARDGRYKKIAPDQPDVRNKSLVAPPMEAWRQARRLVVPLSLRERTAKTISLRGSVPLQVEPDAILGRYNVWVRLVRSRSDKTTSWKRANDVVIK